MTVLRSLLLFVVAALAEIGGAWLIWQGWREHRGLWWIAGGVIALGAYGFVATFQPDPNFGRILAAYGGVFVAGSLAWGMLVDKFRPDRWDDLAAGRPGLQGSVGLSCVREGERGDQGLPATGEGFFQGGCLQDPEFRHH